MNYFGEKSNTSCNQCDVCLSKNTKDTIQNSEFSDLSAQLLAVLKEHPLPPYLLIQQMNLEKEKLLPIIRYLIAEDLLLFQDGILSAKKEN